jgi:hypothetical protein
MKLFNKSGFLQAFGVLAYCSLVGLFILNAENIIGGVDRTFGPIIFLLLFSTLVLICAVIVLLKPYKVFVEGKKKEALDIIVSTALWLFVFVIVAFSAIAIFK